MNVKTRNNVGRGLLLSLVLILMLTFASCGTKTLEKYVNDNAELKQQIESIGAGTGLEVDIKDNVVTYTYKYKETFTDDQLKVVKTSLEQAMSKAEGQFTNIVTQLEKETEIDGISVVVKYMNGDDKEIYSKEFK